MTPRLMLALAALLPVLGWAQSVSLHGLLGRQALLIVDGKPLGDLHARKARRRRIQLPHKRLGGSCVFLFHGRLLFSPIP